MSNADLDLRKLLLIINPCAGRMTAVKNTGTLVRQFREAGYLSSVLITMARGEASEYIRRNGSSFDAVACCGGDGTLNEVITGVLDAKLSIPIGYIPCGTTNDLAKSLGLPKTPLAAAKVITDGNICEQDVGRFGENRYFSYVASFGAFARASFATPQDAKNNLGHLAYLLEGIKSIGTIKPLRVAVTLNGHSFDEDFIFAAVTNSTSVGGVMKLDASTVDFRDGLFEVMLVRSPKNANETTKLLNDVLAQKYESGMVIFEHAAQVEFSSESGLEWTLDGESGGILHSVTISNLHRAINLFLPK